MNGDTYRFNTELIFLGEVQIKIDPAKLNWDLGRACRFNRSLTNWTKSNHTLSRF